MRGKVCDKKDEIFLKIPFTKPGGCDREAVLY